MLIERNTTPYVVFSEDTVLTALNKIGANKAGIAFCVDEHGVLQGAISDGDFRRWVVEQHPVDLGTPALAAANQTPVTALVGAAASEIQKLFRPGVDRVPLVDERGHLSAIALPQASEFVIGRHQVGEGHPCLTIAEIGINHNGSVDRAKHLVDLAVESGADLVKFQLRDMESLYRGENASSAGEDLGPQYTMDLLSRFSLPAEHLFEVFDHCRDVDIDVLLSLIHI